MILTWKDYEAFEALSKKIGKDEPIFVLRAKDVCAPDAVNHYGSIAEMHQAAPEFVSDVHRFAARMRDWQKEHVNEVKVPDASLEVL